MMRKKKRIFLIITVATALALCGYRFSIWARDRSAAYVDQGRSTATQGWNAEDQDTRTGYFEQAIADYTRAIKLYPRNADAYLWRGRMYHEGKEDYDRALADFIKAIQLEPGCYPYYTWRGRAYWKKKDYDLAIADFTESINLNSSYDTYKERGDVYHDKGDYELAIADYDRAIAAIDESIAAGDRLFEEHPEWYTSAPDHTEINKERDFVAYVKEKTEKALAYSRVIEEHTGVIRLNPGDASAYVGRGDVYRDERDYELAIADYTEAIRLRPGEVSYYKHRAEVYAEARNYSRASEEYTRLVKLDPKNADYHNYYAEAYAEVARERGSREGITLDDLILEMDIHDSAPSYE